MHSVQSTPLKPQARYRLGFPVKVVGALLPSHDSRRWQNQPHLSVSLAYLRDMFEYLRGHGIQFYRLAGQLAPYLTHPDLPAFHRQIEECADELAAVGDMARGYGIRLTLHPAHYVQLSSPDAQRAARARQELAVSAQLLDAMGLGAEAVIVVHMGGVYGDAGASRERFVHNILQLPASAQARLALENDDRHFGLQDALWAHRQTGVRVVLDTLHHRCLNPGGHPLTNALALALETWPAHEQPKIHLSSPRTALRYIERNRQRYLQPPLPNQHSDFIDPFAFIDLLRNARAMGLRPFDIMLEAKAKDVALLRLREQIAKYAAELVALVA
ncbi:MAG: UV DNA damage repair endonuclease UvsE [Caldilineaceae bacterium]|nr:UV DNA damage repair endonuclease UvsE [Caldilineaceae bacterium]